MVQRRTCEICGVKEVRADKSLRFSRFPFNESICKKWVAACGKEDLVSLPIEKINKNRYVCWNHFATKYKLKRQLKKRAIPTLNLLLAPLTENQMVNFPQHLYRNTLGDDNEEHDYSDIASGSRPDSDQLSVSEEDQPPEHETGTKVNEEDPPPELETGKKASEANEFTWENNTPVLCDQELEIQESSYIKDVEDISMFGKEVASAVGSSDDNYSHQRVPDAVEGGSTAHEWYKCNECSGDISGLRYTCVECADFDLCCSCESRGAHAAHYVLRVPGPRSHSEIQSVLTTIRRLLLNKSVTNLEAPFADEVLDEVKEELDPHNVELGSPTPDRSPAASIDTYNTEYLEEFSDTSKSSDEEDQAVRLLGKRNILSYASPPRRKRKRRESEASTVSDTSTDDTSIHHHPPTAELITTTKPNTNQYYSIDTKKKPYVCQRVISKDGLLNTVDASRLTQTVEGRMSHLNSPRLEKKRDESEASLVTDTPCDDIGIQCKPTRELIKSTEPNTNLLFCIYDKNEQTVLVNNFILKDGSRNGADDSETTHTVDSGTITQPADANSPTLQADACLLTHPDVSNRSTQPFSDGSPTQPVEDKMSHTSSPRLKRNIVESKATSVSESPCDDTRIYNPRRGELITSTKPNTNLHYYFDKKNKQYVVVKTITSKHGAGKHADASEATQAVDAVSTTQPNDGSSPTQSADVSNPTQPVEDRMSRTSSLRLKRSIVESKAISVSDTPRDDTRIQYDPLKGELITSTKPNTNLHYYIDNKNKQYVVVKTVTSKDGARNRADASEPTQATVAGSTTQPNYASRPTQSADASSPTQPVEDRMSHTRSPRLKRNIVESKAISVSDTPCDDTRIEYNPRKGELITSIKPNTNLHYYIDKKNKQYVLVNTITAKDGTRNRANTSGATQAINAGSTTQPANASSSTQPVAAINLTEPVVANSPQPDDVRDSTRTGTLLTQMLRAYVPLQRLTTLEIKAALRKS